MNGKGTIQYDEDGDGEYRYLYSDGILTERQVFGRGHALRLRVVYGDQARRSDRKDEWGRPYPEANSARVSEVHEFDEQGFIRETRALGLDGKPVKFAAGYFEVRYQRDPRGLEQRECYFDASSKPTTDRWGVHCIEHAFDQWGNSSDSRYIGLKMQPTESIYGTHRGHHEYDEFGNLKRTSWFALGDEPIRVTDHPGRCAVHVMHIADGQRVGADCLNEHGRPNPYRAGHASWRERFDTHGSLVESRWFGPDGRPIATTQAARATYIRDENGAVIEQTFYLPNGTKGQRRGPATIVFKRGAFGLVQSERYFDAHRQPTTQHGCALLTYEWDQFRQLSSSTCRDEKGMPRNNDDGVAVRRFQHDAFGRLERESFWGADGAPANSDEGFASIVTRHDVRSADTRKEFFDATNTRVELPRFRAIRVRPPFVTRDFVSGSRARALAIIEDAQLRLSAGEDFERVALTHSDLEVTAKNPGDAGYLRLSSLYPALKEALKDLNVGEVSQVVEIPSGLFVYQRTE